MRVGLRRGLTRGAIPGWVPLAWRVVQTGGDLDFVASAWSRGGDTVLNLIKEWGWLFGFAWLIVIILWPSRPQWLRRGVVTDGAPATPPGEPVSDQLQSLQEKNLELALDLEEERKAQVEAALLRQDLAKAKEPSPPIPDERLVILFRGYALPAHNSLSSTMEQITHNCFNQGE